MKVEQRTAELAEITTVLERMSRRTRSETGGSMLRGMLPAPSIKAARQRQELLKSYARYVETRGELPWDERMKPLGPLLENAGETALLSVELLPSESDRAVKEDRRASGMHVMIYRSKGSPRMGT